MAHRKISPYSFRTLKRTKVNGVKISMRSYGRKPYTDIYGVDHARQDIYFEIRTNQGGYSKVLSEDEAFTKYDQMVEFEKHQLSIGL